MNDFISENSPFDNLPWTIHPQCENPKIIIENIVFVTMQ